MTFLQVLSSLHLIAKQALYHLLPALLNLMRPFFTLNYAIFATLFAGTTLVRLKFCPFKELSAPVLVVSAAELDLTNETPKVPVIRDRLEGGVLCLTLGAKTGLIDPSIDKKATEGNCLAGAAEEGLTRR
jgi:hypothetical protein